MDRVVEAFVAAAKRADRAGFANVTLLTTITCQYCMELENNLPVYLCTNPTFTSIAQIWPQVRQYD